MADARLPNVFSPLDIRGMRLKNRLVMPAMGNRYPSFYSSVTKRMCRYYAEAARGGVGLIIVQFTCVAPEGRGGSFFAGLWDDNFIPGFRRLVADVHKGGAAAAVQLAHAGATASSSVIHTRPVGPSAVALRGGEMPRPLSTAEVQGTVEQFAQAARRARDAGFDAVEIHAAHGYLLNQFISPLWNHRDDQYGGNTENRARIIAEIVRRSRELLGDGFPIIVRLCVNEFLPEGIDIEEGCRIARIVESAGADLLDVTGGIGETFARSVPATFSPPFGSLVPLAAAVKETVRIPVVAVGKLQKPEIAEAVIASGKADLVALGRALIADPYWPVKAAEGRWDQIRPCVGCNSPECHGRTAKNMDMACIVNPTVGREDLYATSPVSEPKKILVVGGGASGMEAAAAGARRGHQVFLWEESKALGGQLPLAAAPPHKDELYSYLAYLKRTIELSAVHVKLNTRVDLSMVKALAPHVVVVATGSTATVPRIKVDGTQVATAREIVGGQIEAGKTVVVVGGGDVGCETADYLAVRGRQVTVLEMLPDIANELIWFRKQTLVQRLMENQVEVLTNSQLVSIDGGIVSYRRGGIVNRIEGVDTVVMATGAVAENGLGKELMEAGFEVRMAGDCVAPGSVGQAVRAGFEAGITIE